MADKTSANVKPILVIATVGVVVAVLGVAMFSSDSDLSVPVPTTNERVDTVTVLQKAAQAQNICYGWRLQDHSRMVSAGSNLGDGTAVDSDPQRCPRSVQVIADISYVSEGSESNDRVSIRVWRDGRDDSGLVAGLGRLGLDEKAFLDDPSAAISRAAMALPLLVAEDGDAPIVPVATASPTAAVAALPDPGSDMWRDRWGYLVAGLVLLLVTVLLVAIGWHQRSRQRQRFQGRATATATVGGVGQSKTPQNG